MDATIEMNDNYEEPTWAKKGELRMPKSIRETYAQFELAHLPESIVSIVQLLQRHRSILWLNDCCFIAMESIDMDNKDYLKFPNIFELGIEIQSRPADVDLEIFSTSTTKAEQGLNVIASLSPESIIDFTITAGTHHEGRALPLSTAAIRNLRMNSECTLGVYDIFIEPKQAIDLAVGPGVIEIGSCALFTDGGVAFVDALLENQHVDSMPVLRVNDLDFAPEVCVGLFQAMQEDGHKVLRGLELFSLSVLRGHGPIVTTTLSQVSIEHFCVEGRDALNVTQSLWNPTVNFRPTALTIGTREFPTRPIGLSEFESFIRNSASMQHLTLYIDLKDADDEETYYACKSLCEALRENRRLRSLYVHLNIDENRNPLVQMYDASLSHPALTKVHCEVSSPRSIPPVALTSVIGSLMRKTYTVETLQYTRDQHDEATWRRRVKPYLIRNRFRKKVSALETEKALPPSTLHACIRLIHDHPIPLWELIRGNIDTIAQHVSSSDSKHVQVVETGKL